MATCSWHDGKFSPRMFSVTGCSTCNRGLSSRKANELLSSRKRYSTVPALQYPTVLANDTAAFSIARNVASEAAVGGPSSMIFWCRRCTEQSRPLRAMAWPCLSASNCTSK